MYIYYLSIHQLINIWVVSTFWLLGIVLLENMGGHVFPVLLVYTCLAVELLSHKSRLCVFSVVACAFGVISKKHCLIRVMKTYAYVFSKNFIVLLFIFRPLIHFVLLFVYCEVEVQLHSSHMEVQLSQHHLLKRLFSLAVNVFGTAVNN